MHQHTDNIILAVDLDIGQGMKFRWFKSSHICQDKRSDEGSWLDIWQQMGSTSKKYKSLHK